MFKPLYLGYEKEFEKTYETKVICEYLRQSKMRVAFIWPFFGQDIQLLNLRAD